MSTDPSLEHATEALRLSEHPHSEADEGYKGYDPDDGHLFHQGPIAPAEQQSPVKSAEPAEHQPEQEQEQEQEQEHEHEHEHEHLANPLVHDLNSADPHHQKEDPYLSLWGAPHEQHVDLNDPEGDPFNYHLGHLEQLGHEHPPSTASPEQPATEVSAVPQNEATDRVPQRFGPPPAYTSRPRRGSGAGSIAPARPPSLFDKDDYTDLPGKISIGPRSQALTHTLRRRLFIPYPQQEVVLGEHGELLETTDDSGSHVKFAEDTVAKPGQDSAYDFVKEIVKARRDKAEADLAAASGAARGRAAEAEKREANAGSDAHPDFASGLYTASDLAGAETNGVLFDDVFDESSKEHTQPEPKEQDYSASDAQTTEADQALTRSLIDAELTGRVADVGPRQASQLSPDDLFVPDPRPWKPLRWVRRTNPRQLLLYVAGTVLPPHEPQPSSAGKGTLPKSGSRGGIGVSFSPPTESDPWAKYMAQSHASAVPDSNSPTLQVTSPDGPQAELNEAVPALPERREADLARRLEAAPPGARLTPQRAVLRAALAALEWIDWWRASPAGADAKAVVIAAAEPWVVNGMCDWIHGWRRDGWVLSGTEGQRQLGPAGARVPDRDLWELLDAVVHQYEEAGCAVLFWLLPEFTPGLVAARLAAAEGAARPKQQPALVRWRKKEAQNSGSQPLRGVGASKRTKPPKNPLPLSTVNAGISMAMSASIVKNNPRAAKYLFSGK